MSILVLSNRWLRVAAITAIAGFALPAFASLGGDVTTVQADRARMGASIRVTQSANYTLEEMTSPAGAMVNEYVSPAGEVFAVAWHGHFMPQMSQILGDYFSQYQSALQAQPRHYGHRPLNIQLPGLVVQTGGHMGDYFGRAYVPGMLPNGVSAEAIR